LIGIIFEFILFDGRLAFFEAQTCCSRRRLFFRCQHWFK